MKVRVAIVYRLDTPADVGATVFVVRQREAHALQAMAEELGRGYISRGHIDASDEAGIEAATAALRAELAAERAAK